MPPAEQQMNIPCLFRQIRTALFLPEVGVAVRRSRSITAALRTASSAKQPGTSLADSLR
jgi:hypothetical protein